MAGELNFMVSTDAHRARETEEGDDIPKEFHNLWSFDAHGLVSLTTYTAQMSDQQIPLMRVHYVNL